jgi:DNA polymerase delta subunit 2
LHDLLKYTRGHSTLDCLQQLLERSHLVPTCPDTIDAHPIGSQDPFCIEEIPHVLFVGNQPNHEAKICELANGARTLLMTIPKFSRKHEAILLNLRTLETEVFRFENMLTS